MSHYKVLKSASLRLDGIYQYTQERWGEDQAADYILGLFQHFNDIASGLVLLRPIPAEFEVEGFVSRYEKHFVYSKTLSTGETGIVTILHEKMHQIERFAENFK